MTTEGIEGLLVETYNWGKTVAFWKALGYELELETGHGSGRLRHPSGGPYVFVAERPEGSPIEIRPVLGVKSAEAFEAPRAATVSRPFEKQHWNVLELLVRDPDGRTLAVQAPLGRDDGREERCHG